MPRPGAKREKIYIYGKHALAEALLHAPHAVRKAFLSPTLDEPEISRLLKQERILTTTMNAREGRELAGRDAVHQGIIALVDPSALLTPLDAFLASLDLAKKPAIAVLGEVQDPGNVGAIIRSAAALGLAGILIPEHRQAPVTGTVVKASAGMAFRIPLVSAGNVNTALAALKKKGFWIYGLAMDGTASLADEAFDTPVAFVVGNEGAGLREKTREACDLTLSIPMNPRTESLNAAASAAIVFYKWSTRHPEALS
jgi:23S rRNA (guanosine2251-2'-O)-methyltransferase